MKKIRVGIIGTGSIANNVHIPGYMRLADDGVEMVAVEVFRELAACRCLV